MIKSARKYTILEINRMRTAVHTIVGGLDYGRYDDRWMVVEALLRTFMFNGTEVEEIEQEAKEIEDWQIEMIYAEEGAEECPTSSAAA